jgi:zinc/manganese transport system substrate-binding protein
VAALEPKPGVEPSAAYLARLVEQTAASRPRLVLRAAYNNPRPADWFSAQAKVPVVVLPFTVGGNEAAKDLFGLFDDTVRRLAEGMK